ncbi:MoaA/NifB/PqqE/SkfB family radical SAM enzyme [Spinactinospora alkalitolerans]|uniref:MoaA/NifB/PqqE/SkfB family radical SAM enzyme n=1 Tax=Spinactinospora alkalitolerans TaxID=687207 RepID=A0A852U3J1_9ACTN|nr:radical SAM protein [Spinactinospora alkalitolerans]NYE50042.1 MoaA/NifB/PqqE/SkfB family radical SAM enzyme [Spinactinospora alkalitolerans]
MITPTKHEPLPGIRRVDKLYLELLFRCNFRCLHCYHGADLNRPERVEPEQAVGALDYFAEHYGCAQVCFLGGEPLLYPGLPDLLAAAKQRGFHTEICTNGYRRYNVLDRCRSHLDLLRVSLDGGTAEAHDRIRRPGSFAAAFDTLTWARDRGLVFGATCTLTEDNIGTIPALAMRLHELGARELILHRLRTMGNAAQTSLREVTWEHTERLHVALTGMNLTGLHINREILLPERCPASGDVVEKLEIAPDGRVYLSCAEVAGNGRDIRFDFARAALVNATESVTR